MTTYNELKKILAAGKYKPGEFGYYWTVELGNEDIEGKKYEGSIDFSEKPLSNYRNYLKSLKGCPSMVKGKFGLRDCNQLPSLKYGPKEVEGDFSCGWCDELTSLEGAPNKVTKDFYCAHCKRLLTLKGAPEYVGRDFNIMHCNKLANLEYLPKYIGKSILTTKKLSKKAIEDLRSKSKFDKIYYV